MDKQLETVFILLIIYQIKHFVADFPLQREYMLKKTSANMDFIVPLGTHCLVHGLGTLLICLVFAPQLYWLSVVDFVCHFIIDRVKSAPQYLGRFNDMTKAGFWNTLGLDQMLHHLTHIYLIYVIAIS